MGEENVEAVPVDKLPPPKVPLQVIIVITIMIFILISNIMTPKISMNCSLNKLPPAKIVISYRHSLQLFNMMMVFWYMEYTAITIILVGGGAHRSSSWKSR